MLDQGRGKYRASQRTSQLNPPLGAQGRRQVAGQLAHQARHERVRERNTHLRPGTACLGRIVIRREEQVKIWKELMDIDHYFQDRRMHSGRIYEKGERDSQKIFEINNKLSEIIKLSERHIEVHCNTTPERQLREILELLISIDYKIK